MPRTSSHSVRHDAVPEAVVVAAARTWFEQLRRDRLEVVRAGYFGSYARGDYVPASDFDVLLEVTQAPEVRRFEDRVDPYLPKAFPVGMSLLVYTTDELARLRAENNAFIRSLESEMKSLD